MEGIKLIKMQGIKCCASMVGHISVNTFPPPVIQGKWFLQCFQMINALPYAYLCI